MTATDVINNVLAGGLLGLIGQGIRMAVGLKKLSDENSRREESEPVNASRLIISLFIGFVAGALYVLVNEGLFKDDEYLFAIIAAGYAGADFIEGIFRTFINKSGNTSGGSSSVSTNTGNTNNNQGSNQAGNSDKPDDSGNS
jgi:hypothetical protein